MDAGIWTHFMRDVFHSSLKPRDFYNPYKPRAKKRPFDPRKKHCFILRMPKEYAGPKKLQTSWPLLNGCMFWQPNDQTTVLGLKTTLFGCASYQLPIFSKPVQPLPDEASPPWMLPSQLEMTPDGHSGPSQSICKGHLFLHAKTSPLFFWAGLLAFDIFFWYWTKMAKIETKIGEL